MKLLRDHIRTLLDTLDGIDVDPAEVSAKQTMTSQYLTIKLTSCADYEAVCRAHRAKPEPGRITSHGELRTRDSLAGNLLIVHHCFRHLDCWPERAA